MSDNLYENLHFPEDDEKTQLLHETPQRATDSDNAPVPEPVQRHEPVQQPAEAPKQQPYVNPYAERSDFRQPVPPREDVVRNPYQPAGTPSYSRPDPVPTASQPEQNMNDGFYHYNTRATEHSRNVYSGAPHTPQRPENNWNTTSSGDGDHKKEKKSGGGLSKGGIALLLVICIIISGLAGFGGSILAQKINSSKYESNDTGTMVIHKVNTEKEDSDDKTADKSTETITNEVADSVVEITTEIMQTSKFYGQYISQGAGSGVIISKDGYIVTNNHVIAGASSIKVTTRGGDSYDAKLVGTDAKVDIALLKVEASDLPVAVFGDSSKLAVGAKAVIIGNPLGTLGGSVTEGIISALDRSIVIDGKTMHLMQTDAAVNPGNSGGGMFDGQGTLAGIVVAKSSSEEIDNIGFVIPINDVIEIIDDLKDYGYVRGRADTGMTFIDLSNSMFAWYYYGTSQAGVYINSVESGSNAAKAGFTKGDRVVSLDGKEVSKAEDITTVINDKSAGDKVTFEIERKGSKQTIELTLDEDVPDQNDTSSNSSSQSNNSGNGGSQGGNPFGGFYGNR